MIIPRNKSIEMSKDIALEQSLEVILANNINNQQFDCNLIILGETCKWKNAGVGDNIHKYLAKG